MDNIMKHMIKCQPGQQIISEEGGKIAGYINYTQQENGYSPYDVSTFKLRFFGLWMQVMTWEGSTGSVKMNDSDPYLADFLSVIGEEAEYVLADRGKKMTVRIFWKSGDEALLCWGSDSYTTQMGLSYGQGGMSAAEHMDRRLRDA